MVFSDPMEPSFMQVAGDVGGSGGGDAAATGEWNDNKEVSAPDNTHKSLP